MKFQIISLKADPWRYPLEWSEIIMHVLRLLIPETPFCHTAATRRAQAALCALPHTSNRRNHDCMQIRPVSTCRWGARSWQDEISLLRSPRGDSAPIPTARCTWVSFSPVSSAAARPWQRRPGAPEDGILCRVDMLLPPSPPFLLFEITHPICRQLDGHPGDSWLPYSPPSDPAAFWTFYGIGYDAWYDDGWDTVGPSLPSLTQGRVHRWYEWLRQKCHRLVLSDVCKWVTV